MPDITMCRNDKCTLKEACYRYTAKPSERQSYTVFSGDEWCKHFWPVHTMYTNTADGLSVLAMEKGNE